MENGTFVNHYEILGVSLNADSDVIEHKFRHLARRYHPDNQATGDRARFESILVAHDTLKDAVKRARYHSDFQHHLGACPPLGEAAGDSAKADESQAASENEASGDDEAAGDGFGIERDVDIQNRLLTMLYLRRRTNIQNPGVGDAELEVLSGCPENQLDFHLWYLKEKGWIARGDDGLIAITVEGVDRTTSLHKGPTKRITDRT